MIFLLCISMCNILFKEEVTSKFYFFINLLYKVHKMTWNKIYYFKMLFRVGTGPFLYCTLASHLSLLRYMYHVNTEFAYGEREDELSVLEATFFIDVAKPSAIDTVRYYRLLYVKFFFSGKIKTCLWERISLHETNQWTWFQHSL